MSTNGDGYHELGRKLTEAGVAFFVCPRCSTINVNHNDVRERYCGRCHRFADDPAPEDNDKGRRP